MTKDKVSYSKLEHVYETELNGQSTLLDYNTGVYIGLDDVGTFIWGHLDGERTVDDVVKAVATAYNIGTHTAEADVLTFLEELLSLKLIQA